MEGIETIKHCDKEDCKDYFSCEYLKSRFNIKECTIGHQIIVNSVHLKELQDREELLKGLGK